MIFEYKYIGYRMFMLTHCSKVYEVNFHEISVLSYDCGGEGPEVNERDED
jgi:hypothetical protein